jgi:hypothetical protein
MVLVEGESNVRERKTRVYGEERVDTLLLSLCAGNNG